MRFNKNSLVKQVKRFMNLHEYQAASLLASYNLPMLKGGAAGSADEANKIAKTFDSGIVIKAQIHAGGRGRGSFKNSGLKSGVHIMDNDTEVKSIVSKMLGDYLVTKQSGSEGKPVNKVFLVEKINLERELYLAILIDRANACPVFIASPKGGMGIEEIDKEFILQERGTMEGFTEAQISKIADFLQPKNSKQKEELNDIVRGLFNCFKEKDATLVEINPLGINQEGKVLVCDCKVNIDDNSKPRQVKLFEQEDLTQKNQIEVNAENYDLNYVKLDGKVGCMVNGAGLAMATMDLINFNGGTPANFLDVGGTATTDRVKQAISIINDDQDVKSILINIFGGIVKCDIVVDGVIKAVKELNINKPIIMRIKGTNSEQAEKMVKDSGLKIFWYNSVDEAAKKAISLSN